MKTKNEKNISVYSFLLLAGLTFQIDAPRVQVGGACFSDFENLEVKLYEKQGDKWILTRREKVNEGFLVIKNVHSGWFQAEVDEDDLKKVPEEENCLLLGLRMLDEEGRKLKDESRVRVYVNGKTSTDSDWVNSDDEEVSCADNEKCDLGEYKTDKEGYIVVFTEPGAEIKIDVKDESSLSGAGNKTRIKVRSKIDGSDWFKNFYQNTDSDKVLYMKDVLPGKYKFKYKTGDASLKDTFFWRIKMRDDKGREVKKNEKVKLKIYLGGKVIKTKLKTDKDGWLMIPGILTEVYYKLSI